jgi:hypothetical protein
VALLTAAGAEFKIIHASGEFGTLVVAPPAKSRFGKHINPNYPRGERTAYVRAHVADMKVGDVKSVPFGPYPPADMQGMVAPPLGDLWGKGSFQTQTTATGVDVLRVL